jgi:hypothetical protein
MNVWTGLDSGYGMRSLAETEKDFYMQHLTTCKVRSADREASMLPFLLWHIKVNAPNIEYESKRYDVLEFH